MLRVHPRRLPETTYRQLFGRAVQIAWVVAKHFAVLVLGWVRRRGLSDDAVARPLRLTFQELGGTFAKYGQLIGSAPGVFGDDFADEFRACLDTGPPVPLDEVRAVIEDELGMDLGEAFASFDPEPIGRASIAVVHRARTHGGDDVAVKVLRPGIEHRVAVDLDLFQPLLELVARQTGDQTAGTLLQLFDGFRQQLGEELDLRNEARAMEHFRGLLAQVDLPLLTVPEVHLDLSSSRVLTMTYLDGVPVDDLAGIEALGVDPRPIVLQLVQGFLLTAIRWGSFHGDVHAGNLLLLGDGRVGVIDWGIVARLDPETHRYFRRLVEAALGDESAWPELAEHVAKVIGPALRDGLGLEGDDLVAFCRSMMEPLLTAPFGEVSLAAMLDAPQEQLMRAKGLQAKRRSVGAVLRRFREQRRVWAQVEAHGAVASDWDRSTYLLTKQLMYFERYGKLYLADVSLFADREFFEKVLAEPIG